MIFLYFRTIFIVVPVFAIPANAGIQTFHSPQRHRGHGEKSLFTFFAAFAREALFSVIPAKAGIQEFRLPRPSFDKLRTNGLSACGELSNRKLMMNGIQSSVLKHSVLSTAVRGAARLS